MMSNLQELNELLLLLEIEDSVAELYCYFGIESSEIRWTDYRGRKHCLILNEDENREICKKVLSFFKIQDLKVRSLNISWNIEQLIECVCEFVL